MQRMEHCHDWAKRSNATGVAKAARRRVSFEEAPLDRAEEKRKRVCARGERRMQRMEHCHDWAEKEQCDRSRESRVRTSELRRSRIENKNADLKRLF